MSDDMTNEVEKNYLALSPTQWPNATPGSIEILADCGHQCYISVSGQRAMADDPDLYETLCVPCLQKHQAESEEPLNFGEVPGAKEQLQQVFGISEGHADILIASVYDHLRNPRV